MSAYKDYDFLSNFVQKKLDLQETFITATELLEYCEEAIKFCEAEIHKLNIEDQYFVACEPLPFVEGQSELDLPDRIYGNKVLRLVYNVQGKIFDLPRLRIEKRYEVGALLDQYPTSDDYTYMLMNNDPRSGTKVRLFPKARETSIVTSFTGTTTIDSKTVSALSSTTGLLTGYFITGTGIADGTRIESVGTTTLVLSQPAIATGTTVALTATEPRLLCWFIRHASIPTTATDLIDFPEFWNFIAQFMIVQCLSKELGNPRLMTEEKRLEVLKEQVLSTLSNMVPDQDDTIEKDVESYREQGSYEGGVY